jgi:hypothetical protein
MNIENLDALPNTLSRKAANGGRNYDDYDETKSVRSNARPLNIALG